MKRIHITESKLNEIYSYNEFVAGTDTPYFEDERTGESYEAAWNGDYGYPFGYWPVSSSEDMEFSLGDAWTTHVNACGKCAKEYYSSYVSDGVDSEASEVQEALENFVNHYIESDFRYDEESGYYVSADGSEEYDIDDFTSEIEGEIYNNNIDPYTYIHDFVERFVEYGGNAPTYNEVYEYFSNNSSVEQYDWTEESDIDRAMQELGMSFQEYFEKGESEGRIWPNKEMIGFYVTEQPDPDTLISILRELSQRLDIPMDSLYQYHMVFEDWRNDGTITACTVQNYIDGNYGPESYEDLDDEDDEDDAPIQYNNGQKTVFVPHLANQQDKFNYYRDFRNTRDRAVYAPQERAAGNLAAYHAMRYPYGESKDKIGKIIREVIEKNIQETYPPLTELENGIYKGYYYACIFELRDGRKYRTKIGIKCSKKGCGGLKKFKITGDGTPHQIENKMGD